MEVVIFPFNSVFLKEYLSPLQKYCCTLFLFLNEFIRSRKSLLQSKLCKLKASPITLLNNFISSHLVVVLCLITNCRCQFPVFYSCRNISSGYSIFKSAVDILTFLPSLLRCSNQNKDWRDCGCRMLLPCHIQANNQNMVRSLFCARRILSCR
jgi:hypothetical protein